MFFKLDGLECESNTERCCTGVYKFIGYMAAVMNYRHATDPSLHSVLFCEFIVKTANLLVVSMLATYNRYGA